MEEGLKQALIKEAAAHKELLRSVVSVAIDGVMNTVDAVNASFVKKVDDLFLKHAASASAPSGVSAGAKVVKPAINKEKEREDAFDLPDLVMEDMDIPSPAPAPRQPPARVAPHATKSVHYRLGSGIPPKPKGPASLLFGPSAAAVVEEEEQGAKRPLKEDSESDSSFSSSSSSSSSSSDSSGEEEPKKKASKASKSEYKESVSDDDFVASDSEEPEVYDKEVMDEYVRERNEADIAAKAKARKGGRGGLKRPREKTKLWSPADHDHERAGAVFDLMREEDMPVSKEELKDFSVFVMGIRTYGSHHVQASPWFAQRYGKALAGIRDNLGLQSKKNQAGDVFDAIIEQCLSDDLVHPTVTNKRMGAVGKKICCLCNTERNCPHTLWLTDPQYEAQVGQPIAICCSALAKALIAFFKEVYAIKQVQGTEPTEALLNKLDQLFTVVQEAHAGKAEKKR